MLLTPVQRQTPGLEMERAQGLLLPLLLPPNNQPPFQLLQGALPDAFTGCMEPAPRAAT